ncbi:MAG: DUF4357 domain-containing protein [Nitrospirae bacterium]|nr:MAG: DUF4357 domain-containing protein [Nitrospirota bacterium]
MKSPKGQLVCQHLENISRDALEKHQTTITSHVKGKHGIYALFRRGRLNYVGLASDLRNRLKTHLRDRHASTWDRFSIYLTVNNDHLRDLEALVLKIATPEGNRKPGTFARSENIMSAFKQDIENKHQQEMDHLLGRKNTAPVLPKQIVGKITRAPSLAAYVKRPVKLRMTYKGTLYKAIVRQDGTILYKGQLYNSPSHAAHAIIKRSVNGWVTWKYQQTPGEWVLLDKLRKK